MEISKEEKSICFVCLESCKNNFCDVCTCCAHPKCLKMYTDSQKSINAYCPVCKSILHRVTTRSKTLDARWKILVRYFRKIMWEIDTELNKSMRQFLSKCLFKTVTKNKYLIKKKSIMLYNTIKNKLESLCVEGWKPANEYLYKLTRVS